MKFNILHSIESAAMSFVTSGGNPIAAGVGAVSGGFSGDAPPQGAGSPGAPNQDLLNELLQNTPSLASLNPLSPQSPHAPKFSDTSTFADVVFDGGAEATG